MGRRLLYDCETDGLLESSPKAGILTRIHCISIRDIDTKEHWSFADNRQTDKYPDITVGLDMLSQADEITAHNGINFDSCAIEKCYPTWTYKKHNDTMVVSRAWYSDIQKHDFKNFRRAKFPAYLLFEPHSIESWGWRLGHKKGDFEGPWDKWTQEMHDYMIQDTVVLEHLINHFQSLNIPLMVTDTELELADWLKMQRINGFKFDVEKGVKLYAYLQPIRADLANQLKDMFGFWYAPAKTEKDGQAKTKTPSKTIRYRREHLPEDVRETFTAGAAFTPVKQVLFNPGSRNHIAFVLQKRYGWKPEEFTDNGHPKVSDDIMSALPYDCAPLLTRYLMHDKRIGQVAEGDQAWLKVVDPDGFIHGNVNQSGAVTHRATHSKPNVSQVPTVEIGDDKHPLLWEAGLYGWECRECWTAPDGFTLVGADASGLELRCLGHYMARYDDGAYIDLVLNGDIHTANWEAGKPYIKTRYQAKRFIYAFLYGAGDRKLGSIVIPQGSEEEQRQTGAKMRSTFLKNVPALGALVEAVAETTRKRGWFKLPTGHIVPVRHQHAALNSLLQATGAVICKRWLYHLSRDLKDSGIPPVTHVGLRADWSRGDWSPCVWSHDEVQIAVRKTPGLPERIGEMVISIFPRITQELNFRCPLAGEYKGGQSWAHTH